MQARRPRRPFAALPILAALTLAVGGCSGPKKVDKAEQLALHREFALRYYDDGDLLRAEDQIAKALELAPRDEQLLLMKGWVRQRRGSAEDIFVAEQIFRQLAPKDDYRALLGLGQSLERKGVLFWESAEAVAGGERMTAAADPEQRSRELRQSARSAWRESIEWYERTLEEKPGTIQAVNGLQRVHALAGEYAESLAWAEQLLEQSGAEVAFWAKQLERPDLGAGEERRLRDLLASSSQLQTQTHLQASTLLVQLDRSEEALDHVELALALDPDDPQVHSRRAQLLHALGRPAEAVASLEDYLRLSEEDYSHPDIVRALDLLTSWKAEAEIRQAADL